jgi:hypothetical protein
MSNEYSVIHGLIGCFAVGDAIGLHVGPVWTWVIVLGLAILHEWLDGDLHQGGLPWYLPIAYEGWKDVLSFLVPGPFLYLLLWR